MAFFGLSVGIYPALYFVVEMGFLKTKGILADDFAWKLAFNAHIVGGGVALLIGWLQFNGNLRRKRPSIHRLVGKIYVFSVLVPGGLGGLYVGFFANEGIVSQVGFVGLALAWLFSTYKALSAIRQRQIEQHKRWMIRSYALTFAAVTLRIWLPLLTFGVGVSFAIAYPIIAWVCWVPNLLLAEFLISKKIVP